MITTVINTKNEEANIAQAIRSALCFADEVIVADMQSTDATVMLARDLGARVIELPDLGFVEPGRRRAVDAASHEWVFLLDADEVVGSVLGARLKSLAERDDVDAVATSHATFMFGRLVTHTGWSLRNERHIRFFRRSVVDLPTEIHGAIRVQPGARVVELEPVPELAIRHFNYTTWSHFLQKLDRYTTVEAQRAAAAGSMPRGRTIALDSVKEFWWRFVSSRGYRDGVTGFALSVSMGLYRMMTHMKTRQLLSVGDEQAIRDEYQRIAERETS